MDPIWLKNTVTTLALIVVALYTGYCYGRYREGVSLETEPDYSALSDSAAVLDEADAGNEQQSEV